MAQDAYTIIDEMEAVLAWLAAEFPEVPATNFGLQDVPEQPPDDSFYLRFQNANQSQITGQAFVTQREYQIVHFNVLPDVLARMDTLARRCLLGRMLIPIKDGSMRYIRIGSFSYGNVLDTEDRDDLKAIIGVLNTEIRQSRSEEAFEKINHIYARYTMSVRA